MILASIHDGLDILVEIRVLFQVIPQRFTTAWVRSSSEALLISVIEERNSFAEEHESKSRLHTNVVVVVAIEPARVVMVTDENSEKILVILTFNIITFAITI